MAICTLTLTTKVAWWVNPYIRGVNLFAQMTGMAPDVDKCVAFAMRGITFKVVDK